MKKFCKEVGLDKVTLMTMVVGKNNIEEAIGKNELGSSRKDPLSLSKDNLNTKETINNINTG